MKQLGHPASNKPRPPVDSTPSPLVGIKSPFPSAVKAGQRTARSTMRHIIEEGNDNEKVGRAHQLQAQQFAHVLGRFEGTGL